VRTISDPRQFAQGLISLRISRIAPHAVTFAAILAFMGYGALQVSVSEDASEAMLEKQGVAYQNYQDYLDHFPSDVGAVVVFVDLLCDEAGWSLIKEVERTYRAHPSVRKTISIASPSARFITVDRDEVSLDRFRDTDFTGHERCAQAYAYNPFRDLLVSRDGEAVALFLVAQDDLDTQSFSESILRVRDENRDRAKALDGDILITGDPIMSTEIANVISRDIGYVAALVVLLLTMTYAITRSLTTCLASFLTITFALVGSFGFMGWFGFEITPGTALAIFLLGPLSAAFVIHAHGYALRSTGPSLIPTEAVVPTLFAGVTTATLFACTGLTPAPDVKALALLGVVGILFATAGIFLIAYPLLSQCKSLIYSVNFAIPRWAIVRPWVSFLLLGMFLLEILVGFSKLRFEYEAVDYLPLTNEKRAEFERIGTWFGRMSIPLMVRHPLGTNEPELWESLNQLERTVESEMEGVQSASFYKHVSEVSLAFTLGESGQNMMFPTDADFLSQLLLVFDQEDYDVYIGDENERLVATFQVPFIGSNDYFKLKELVATHFDNTPFSGNLVGRVSGFFESGHRVGLDNLNGLAIGALLVFLMLVILFRSLTLSSIGLVVNSIPVLTSLAALGIAGVPIDLGSSIVTAIAFGIVVDDSTHLIVRIRRLQQSGYDPSTAVLRAIRELVAPIMATTAMTCVGFCVLFAAEMQPFHDFALTILISMITALIADIVILPVLVRSFVKDRLQSDAA